MNFLEQLVGEWYELQGYFVKTTVRLAHHGYGGKDLDVIAFCRKKPSEIVHIETSTDVKNPEYWRDKFGKIGPQIYEKLFGPHERIRRIAICGFGKTARDEWKESLDADGIQMLSVPEFLRPIRKTLREMPIAGSAVPENYPILRGMQFVLELR